MNTPQNRDPLAAVIVTTCDSPATLHFVLRAVGCQRELPREVIVADDGSAPATFDMLRGIAAELPFPLRHVWQPHTGFRVARSRNNAIHLAQAPKLLFLDQDTIPFPGWLSSHARSLRGGIISLGYKTDLSAEQSIANDDIASGRFTDWVTREARSRLVRAHRKFVFYAWLRRLGLGLKNKPSLGAGNFAAMKADLVQVNGFDEEYEGWGQEDDDLGRRLYRCGLRPAIAVSTAIVCHVPHPLRHPAEWNRGANIDRYHRKRPVRCAHGLDQHPLPDVRVTSWNTTC